MSVPVGVLLVMLGAARLAHAEARLIGFIATATLAVFMWTTLRAIATWPNAQPSLLFGAGGVLMVLFFLGAVWLWGAASAPAR